MIILIRKSFIYLFFTIIISLLLITLLPTFVFSPNAKPLEMPTILLDPGHGGWDGGTHDFNGLLEKNIVLQFAFFLKKELESLNFPIHMTRTTDRELSEFAPYQGTRQRTDLLARVQMVKKYNAKLMISLHVNAASDPKLCGGIVFFQRHSKESKKLATYIQKSFISIQPYNQQTSLSGNFYILNNSPVTTVLLEIAFISNPKEHQDLKNPEYLKEMAHHVANAIYQYHIDKHSRATFLNIFN